MESNDDVVVSYQGAYTSQKGEYLAFLIPDVTALMIILVKYKEQ